MVTTAFLSRSGLLNRGSGGPVSLGAGFLYRFLSPTATAQSGAWGPSLSGCWFSLPHLVSNWLNFLCTELYNNSTSTFFLWASQIALIQPVHGQGYILAFFDRMHLLFTPVHFLFWQPGRVRFQYTTKSYFQIFVICSLYLFLYDSFKFIFNAYSLFQLSKIRSVFIFTNHIYKVCLLSNEFDGNFLLITNIIINFLFFKVIRLENHTPTKKLFLLLKTFLKSLHLTVFPFGSSRIVAYT